jgi:predicted lipid-binding transport protein (Tim44 family)
VPFRPVAKRALIALSVFAALAALPAEARRGGSFGSRGSRTYYAPRSTSVTPGYVPPVSRSMTDRSTATPYQQNGPGYGGGYAQPRRGFGFGGGLLTGLLAGGLIGHFFGGGFGGAGGGGMLAAILQFALIGGVIWLLFRMFAGRRNAAPGASTFEAPSYGAASAAPFGSAAPAYAPPADDLAVANADQEAFERLLERLQEAFGREDYAALREITTPEVMSYLAEELSDNATHGRRNEVSQVRLLDGDVSEAWSENGQDYATVALRYESVDLMRDRTSGAIVSGSTTPSTTTELWTFVRPAGSAGDWKVSAIQES